MFLSFLISGNALSNTSIMLPAIRPSSDLLLVIYIQFERDLAFDAWCWRERYQ